MRFTALVLSALASLSAVSYSNAALPITTMAGTAEPTTAPVSPVSVMLLPFNAVGQNGENSWISQAIDEDLSHDLARNSAIRVVRPSTTQPLKDGDGLAAARAAGADRLISGSYQVVDSQLRVTGEVIDVKQTQSIAQIKATGPVRNLFQLEDELSMQLWHILPREEAPTASADFQVTPLEDYVASQTTPQPQVYERQPEVAAPAADTSPDYGAYGDSYGSFYPYGGYGYGYPYGFGYPLFIYGGYGNHGYHHGGNGGGNWHGHESGAGSSFVAHGAGPRVFAPSAEVHGGGASFAGHR